MLMALNGINKRTASIILISVPFPEHFITNTIKHYPPGGGSVTGQNTPNRYHVASHIQLIHSADGSNLEIIQ